MTDFKKLREEFDKILVELHSKVIELENIAKKLAELDKDYEVLLKAVKELHDKADMLPWLMIGLSSKEND